MTVDAHTHNGPPPVRWLGACIYCGHRISFNARACKQHKDLLRLDPHYSTAAR